jgi:hypothetical protein
MFPELQLATLPALHLLQRDCLPHCPAIYFALDDHDRVLYIGKASSLLARWKDHHRLDQLTRIHKRSPVRLVWLDCSHCIDQLDVMESHYIEFYKPLLNGSQVPAKKIIPAEVALQATLTKISKYSIIFGIAPAMQDSKLPTVNIRYFGTGRVVNSIRRIFKASNHQPTGLQWTETRRRKWGAWWRTRCNGVVIELGPWTSLQSETQQLQASALTCSLAGVEMLALQSMQLEALISQFPYLAENYPGITALETDPIPLLWK